MKRRVQSQNANIMHTLWERKPIPATETVFFVVVAVLVDI